MASKEFGHSYTRRVIGPSAENEALVGLSAEKEQIEVINVRQAAVGLITVFRLRSLRDPATCVPKRCAARDEWARETVECS